MKFNVPKFKGNVLVGIFLTILLQVCFVYTWAQLYDLKVKSLNQSFQESIEFPVKSSIKQIISKYENSKMNSKSIQFKLNLKKEIESMISKNLLDQVHISMSLQNKFEESAVLLNWEEPNIIFKNHHSLLATSFYNSSIKLNVTPSWNYFSKLSSIGLSLSLFIGILICVALSTYIMRSIYLLNSSSKEVDKWEQIRRNSITSMNVLLKLSDIGKWSYDLSKHMLNLGPRWFLIHELERDTDNSISKLDFWLHKVHPDDRDYFKFNFDLLLSNKASEITCKYRTLTSFNKWKWCELMAARIEENNEAKLIGWSKDIDFEYQKALKVSKNYTRLNLLEDTGNIFWSWNASSKIITFENEDIFFSNIKHQDQLELNDMLKAFNVNLDDDIDFKNFNIVSSNVDLETNSKASKFKMRMTFSVDEKSNDLKAIEGVLIPQAAKPHSATQVLSQRSPSLSLSVMVIDDSPLNNKIVQKHLHNLGIKNIQTFTNPQKALNELIYNDKNKFDVVLTDLKMPEISGKELIKKIQAIPSSPAVIALTSDISSENECFKLGVEEFLVKPIGLVPLQSALCKINNNEKNDKIFDEAQLLEQFSDCEEFLVEFLYKFIHKKEDYIHGLEKAIAKNDYSQIEQAAHSYKGILSNFFCKELLETCQKIEDSGRNKKNESLKENLQDVKEMSRELVFCLENLAVSLNRTKAA